MLLPVRAMKMFGSSGVTVRRFACVAALLAMSVTPASPSLGYTFFAIEVDFPSLKDNLSGCSATDLNDEGLIVGGCNDLARNSEFRGFIHDGRRSREIDFTRVRTPSSDAALQNGGVDAFWAARSVYHATLGAKPAAGRAMPARVSGVTPHGINNHAHITGWYSDAGRIRGFLKKNGRVFALNVPNALFTEPNGINDLDQVVGDYLDENGGFHGFSYEGGIYTTIDFPSGGDTGATGVNNLGQIVGCHSLCGRGFLYNPQTAGFTSIDVPGAVVTHAADINDLGQIAGSHHDGTRLHGFVYDQNGFSTIDAPGAMLTDISGINNLGQLTGRYVIESSPGVFEEHAFVASP